RARAAALAGGAGRAGPWIGEASGQAPQERREGLAAAGRCMQEGVVAGADCLPAESLRLGRFRECLREPGAGRLGETGKGIGGGSVRHGDSESTRESCQTLSGDWQPTPGALAAADAAEVRVLERGGVIEAEDRGEM